MKLNKSDDAWCLSWAKRIKAINILGGKCCKCGNDNIFQLEFHHEDRFVKENNINTLKNMRWSLVEKEIKKCELLCSNCHYKIHRFGTKRKVI